MRALLDGLLLPVESKGGWSMKSGTAPTRRTFRMPIPLAKKLLKSAGTGRSFLVVDAKDEGLPLKQFNNLTIIGDGPTDSPYESSLVVVDSRFLWKYKHVFGSFNVTRKTGTIRRIGNAGQQATQKLADTIGFHAWSLNGGKKKWKAIEVLTTVMNQVCGSGNWYLRNTGFIISRLKDIQDLTIDAGGDAAVAQLLSDPAFGGALDVFQEESGKIVVYNRFDGGERPLVGAPIAGGGTKDATAGRQVLKKPAIINQPLWAVQDRKLERPAAVHVLFERRLELRIEMIELLTQLGGTVDPNKLPLYARNVMPSPEDFQHLGRSIIAEQWIEIEFYMKWLAAASKTPPGLPNLSFEVLQKGWASNVLEVYSDVDTTGLWGRRIDYIRQHYRLTWQIEKTWRDRIREIKAERLTSEDRTTGARPNAVVFANYAQFNTWRSSSTRFNTVKQSADNVVSNRFANPIGTSKGSRAGPIKGTEYTKLKPAPALLSILDNDQCIVHFEFGKGSDNTYQVSRFIRSALTKGSIPSDDPTKANQWLQFGALESPYEASVILSADLGSPADNRRYHRVIITPQQAGAVLPSQRVQTGTGPVLQVRVKSSILVARFGWEDKSKSEIEGLFSPLGVGAPVPSILNSLPNPINQNNLNDYALGVAAKAYGSYLDRAEGGLTTGLSDGMTIQGTATEVSFEADPTLGAVTKVVIPGEPPLFDLAAVLPKSVRRVVDRIVDP